MTRTTLILHGHTPATPLQLSRRSSLKWFLAALTAGPLAACGDDLKGVDWIAPPPIDAKGYGTDPNLLEPVTPWPLTLNRTEIAAATALVDLILPADGDAPSASALGVPAFIDEWVSAPYESQRADRELIIPGLAWLDREAQSRFQRLFMHLSPEEKSAMADDLAYPDRIKQGLEKPAEFFARMRSLTIGAYYSTPQGWAELGYVGNRPSTGPYAGPPPEAVDHVRRAVEALGLKLDGLE